MKHPIQNTHIDNQGTLRFVQNDVVALMLTMLGELGADLNAIHNRGHKLGQEDWDQFNQLIGYSVSGAPIAAAIADAAQFAHENGASTDLARAEQAKELLNNIRMQMRDGIAELYGIHSDNLMEPEPEPG